MNYLILSDIFGTTSALIDLAEQLNTQFCIVDPYNGEPQLIEREKEHYNSFKQQCGHDKYFEIVKEYFKTLSEPTTCLAFSAGASAAWRAQSITENPYLEKLVGFYPSQIRNNLAINAKINCEFIFPKHESHFDVTHVIQNLSLKRNVKCKMAQFDHGFMNKLSDNFNESAYAYFCDYLRQ